MPRDDVDVLAAGAHQLGVVMSVSPAHNRINVRRSREESLADFERIVSLRE